MQLQNRDSAYLWDMREAGRLVEEFLHEVNYAQYNSEKILQSAVERQLEILGEAVNHISQEFQLTHPEILWRQIIGLRNVLIHEYGEIKSDRVWYVATENIPDLLAQLDSILA